MVWNTFSSLVECRRVANLAYSFAKFAPLACLGTLLESVEIKGHVYTMLQQRLEFDRSICPTCWKSLKYATTPVKYFLHIYYTLEWHIPRVYHWGTCLTTPLWCPACFIIMYLYYSHLKFWRLNLMDNHSTAIKALSFTLFLAVHFSQPCYCNTAIISWVHCSGFAAVLTSCQSGLNRSLHF